jgi:hypothetical protein
MAERGGRSPLYPWRNKVQTEMPTETQTEVTVISAGFFDWAILSPPGRLMISRQVIVRRLVHECLSAQR